jgi:4-hydroxy-3-polyprenylbenzoate decarboxylase
MRLVVGISGATGTIFGIRVLERLATLDIETHLVISPWGARTIEHETSYTVNDVKALASVVHASNNQAAVLSSGSFKTDGMVVAPCSMKSVAAIASGVANDLLTRAADVTLKEQRKLVLVVRESPLHQIHLANMLKLAQMGVVILPPVPAFYTLPTSVDDIVNHIVVRTLDQFGLNIETAKRWDGQMRRSKGKLDN